MLVGGIPAMLVGVVLMALDERISHRAVAFGVQGVLRVDQQPSRVTPAGVAETAHR